ncbi:outer membrane protein transport protein [Vibrio sp. HN007]|uniref:outer membrane protein transport protein n=1 Tax=Vibrio iocasae TaxID=3098914 RepID=UPI0035D459AE
MKINKSILATSIACSLLTISIQSHAAGFQLAEYSATGLGRAYAGEAAMAENAGAQWRNPAMLTYLEGTQVSFGAMYIDPNVDLNGTVHGSIPANSSDYADSAVVPNLYISHNYHNKYAVGFALGSNYGFKTHLGEDFMGSHVGQQAEIITQEANLNFAYKATDAVSIGGGLRYVMAEGKVAARVSTAAPSSSAGATLKYVEGDTTDWGWQAGIAWQVNPEHRVGFTYKSEVKLKLEGTATGAGFGLVGTTSPGSLPLALPATAELSSFNQLTEKLALHTSINWTDWSSFEKLEADIDGVSNGHIKDENWKDNYRFAVGFSYQADPKLTLRTGVAYDTSAVDDEHRTVTIPETDRTWLSIGAGYAWSEQLTLDAGFTYIIAKDANVAEAAEAGTTALGDFEGVTSANVLIYGVQASYKF